MAKRHIELNAVACVYFGSVFRDSTAGGCNELSLGRRHYRHCAPGWQYTVDHE
jgi:hypothetical protein